MIVRIGHPWPILARWRSRRLPPCGYAAGALCVVICWVTAPCRADEPSPWEFRGPTGKFSEAASGSFQRFQGLPTYQLRLDGEVEVGVSNGVYGARVTPWGYTRAPDLVGGLARQTRGFFELKEGWVERLGTAVDVRAGNQVFAWGAGDGINPTDVWNPRDLNDPFQSNKLPITALQLKIHPPELDQYSLQVIATPFFRPSRLPVTIPDSGTAQVGLDDSRWLLPIPSTVTAGSTLAAPLLYDVTETTYPGTFQGGARLGLARLGGWDFSVAGFSGVETVPRFALTRKGSTSTPSLPVTVTLHPSFHRHQVWGVDGTGSVSFGETEFGTRFEVAYDQRDNSRALEAPPEFQADLLRDDAVHGVAGFDYTFRRKILGTVLYLNLQYVRYQRVGHREGAPGSTVVDGLPNTQPWDSDVVFYWENRMGDRLKLGGNLIASLQNSDLLFSPSVQYKWSDTLRTTLGLDVFGGRTTGFFGQFRDNSRVNLSAAVAF